MSWLRENYWGVLSLSLSSPAVALRLNEREAVIGVLRRYVEVVQKEVIRTRSSGTVTNATLALASSVAAELMRCGTGPCFVRDVLTDVLLSRHRVCDDADTAAPWMVPPLQEPRGRRPGQ